MIVEKGVEIMGISIEAATIHDNCLWYSPYEINGLFKYDFDTQKNEKIAVFPREQFFSRNNHSKCIKVGTKFFFLPLAAKNIHVYDFADQSLIAIPFENMVIDAIAYENKIWMLCGDGFLDLYSIDINSMTISEVVQYKADCKRKLELERTSLTRRITISGKKIWFAVLGDSKVCSWDIEEQQLQVTTVDIRDIFAAYMIDDKLWLTDRSSSKIYCIDAQNKYMEYSPQTYLGDLKTDGQLRFYNNICKYKDGVLVIPACAREFIYIDCQKNEIEKYAYEYIDSTKEQYKNYSVCDGNVVVFPYGNESFKLLNNDGDIASDKILKPTNIFCGISKKELNGMVLEEKDILGLKELLELTVN